VIEYHPDVKTARMGVVRDALVGGRLELLADGVIVAAVPLAGTVADDVLTFEVPTEGLGVANGYADAARMVSADGTPIVTKLTVSEVLGDVVLDSLAIRYGQTVRIMWASLRHA
jgi:hypothetical protein